MHRFIGLIARFRRDERGAFAVMFGLMAVVLIAISGAVVDYVTLEQTRNRTQIALDAAALALQPEIFKTPLNEADIKKRARDLVVDRIGEGWNVVVDDPLAIEVNVDDGSLYLRARVTVPTLFVTLVGVDTLSAQIQSEATRKKLALEVVMVLDNSGSMQSQNRMTYLKEAANCATNILFYSAVIDDPNNANTCIPATGAEIVEEVQMGIVPFTMFVNVGPGNATANWIDKDGISPVSADNFDDDDDDSTAFNGPVDRLQLFEDTANESWRGCVEARPHISTDALDSNRYLDTDDTAAASSDPNTLFVPQFSPDLPYGYGGQSYISDEPAACQATGTCTVVTTNNSCTSKWSGCSSTTTTRTLVGPNTGSYANNYCTCSNTPVTVESQTGSGWSLRYSRTRTWTCSFNYDPQNLSLIEKHERLCKYDGATVPTGFSNGPNADCTREPILPLTNDPDTVIDKIDDMEALGGTNIHEGAAWGFRTLSPEEPFSQGAPYDEATSKVLIIMTDGENTSYNLPYVNNWTPWYCSGTITSLTGNCYYSAYGWPRNDSVATPRLGPMGTANSNLVTQMNERTRQTCENAKADGITIYTIGLSTANVSQSTQAEVEDMLQDCASSPQRAHLPSSPTELKAVFESIANDLSALRLAL